MINYNEQKEIAIEAWNIAAEIDQSIEDFKTQYKENRKQAFDTFVKSMNNMVSYLFEHGKVRSIRQALLIIANDLRDRCSNFPSSIRNMSYNLDPQNTRRLLWRNSVQTIQDLHTFDIEESSTITLPEVTELDLFDNVFYRPRPYDVWNYQLDHTYGLEYPGQIPAGIVFNTLYFFSEQGDLIVDPMAGGGVVGDCCKEVKRKCLMYDNNPNRPDIIPHDILNGLPEEAANADLIFWDPPYYKKKEKEYGPNSISALSRNQYLNTFDIVTKDFYDKGVRRIAFLMSNNEVIESVDNLPRSENIWLYDYINIFHNNNWQLQKEIQCPLSTEQIPAQAIDKFINNKLIARISRSLLIFRRKENGE